jgi:hypothetical protein
MSADRTKILAYFNLKSVATRLAIYQTIYAVFIFLDESNKNKTNNISPLWINNHKLQ